MVDTMRNEWTSLRDAVAWATAEGRALATRFRLLVRDRAEQFTAGTGARTGRCAEPVVVAGLRGLVDAPPEWVLALEAVAPVQVRPRIVAVLPDAAEPRSQHAVRRLLPADVAGLDALDPVMAWISESWAGTRAWLNRVGRGPSSPTVARWLSRAPSSWGGSTRTSVWSSSGLTEAADCRRRVPRP